MIDLLVQGRWFMIPLSLCSIVGLAVILDRWFYLRSVSREMSYMLEQIDPLVESGEVDGIEQFCEGNPGLLSNIFGSGVQKYKQLLEEPNLDFIQHEVTKVMEDASIINTIDLERRLPLLATVGNVSPLFGFAGTVTGMINAFKNIAAAGANVDASVVAVGIQEALVTTAGGLLIAIPCVLLYNYFTSRNDTINARVEESANAMIDMLVMDIVGRRKKAPTGKRAMMFSKRKPPRRARPIAVLKRATA